MSSQPHFPSPRPNPLNDAVRWLAKKGFPLAMWAIYVLGFAIVIGLWVLVFAIANEGSRPIMNVLGCALLAIGGLLAILSKTDPVYTGKHESDRHTKWRIKVEKLSYFLVLFGGLFVFVAAAKDPAFLRAGHDVLQGMGILPGPTPHPAPIQTR